MNLKETSIKTEYTQNLAAKSMEWDDNDTVSMYEILTTSVSEFLGTMKSKENSTALVLKDLKGNFLMAGVIKYFEPTSEGMPGNWSFVLSFDPEDIVDVKVVYDSTDLSFHRFVAAAALDMHRIRFNDPTIVQPLLIALVEVLKKWLDYNAKDGEVVKVELDNFFEAAVEVKDGVKEMGITPIGEMKSRYAKGDAGIEVK